MDRRTFIKMGVGSISASLAWPALAQIGPQMEPLRPVVVYNESSPQGHIFFREILDEGAVAFPIGDTLDPATKYRLYRQLLDRPSLLIGLTDRASAFELQMAAQDAFHFKLPDDRFTVRNSGGGLLIAWAVAPITEIRKGSSA